jgi:hypothetical protein
MIAQYFEGSSKQNFGGKWRREKEEEEEGVFKAKNDE